MKYPFRQACLAISPGVAVSFFLMGTLFSYVFNLGKVDVDTLLRVSNSDGPQRFTDNFIDAWRNSPESCGDWLATQKRFDSYIDAYVIGSQKGATSQLTKHLHMLGIRREHMKKEWHFFNTLDDAGDIVRKRTVAQPLPPLNFPKLRLLHYKTGFPDSNVDERSVPVVETEDVDTRTLVIDSTVEYLHSDRSAHLASVLTPHAKVIVTVRDPIDRALSQYNMVKRVKNKALRADGESDSPSTPREFHDKAAAEIRQLEACGYKTGTAFYSGRTSELVQCMFEARHTTLPDDMLYVTRGLYHMHLHTWRDYFPAHRIHVVSFNEVMAGKKSVYEDLSRFLCMRKFSDEMLEEFEANGTTLSFGQMAAKKGLSKAGFDHYEGNDRYLADILPETRTMLRKFYAPADARLEQLLGKRLY